MKKFAVLLIGCLTCYSCLTPNMSKEIRRKKSFETKVNELNDYLKNLGNNCYAKMSERDGLHYLCVYLDLDNDVIKKLDAFGEIPPIFGDSLRMEGKEQLEQTSWTIGRKISKKVVITEGFAMCSEIALFIRARQKEKYYFAHYRMDDLTNLGFIEDIFLRNDFSPIPPALAPKRKFLGFF